MKMLDASEITYEPHFNSFNDWDYNLMLDASEKCMNHINCNLR